MYMDEKCKLENVSHRIKLSFEIKTDIRRLKLANVDGATD